jgi:hypothetical protein
MFSENKLRKRANPARSAYQYSGGGTLGANALMVNDGFGKATALFRSCRQRGSHYGLPGKGFDLSASPRRQDLFAKPVALPRQQ